MKKIKLVSVDIQADLQNLLIISKEIANTFGTIYDNDMVDVEEFSEKEILDGNVDNGYCPNDYIIEAFQKAVKEKKDIFCVEYETPYYEYEQENGAKGLTSDIIRLYFQIIED